MITTSCIRIHRAGVAYDIAKEAVRRVGACQAVIPIGSAGAFSAELEGLPLVLMEPNAFCSSVAPGDAPSDTSPLPLPKLALVVGESADMPMAIAADAIDTWSNPSAQAVIVRADTIHTVLLNPLQKISP